jgi:hypothetical protein
MDVNAIIQKNRKKKKRVSSIAPSKMIIEVSLPQEGDNGKFVADVNKHVTTSYVVNKVIKVVVGDQNLNNVNIK